ncbi:MAG: peptidylprolyl isomerase [Chthonomonadales bacterium]|nr:peptidylprolyl isomerase [Chthonomonadales bacterium]
MGGARKVTLTIAGKGQVVIEVYPKAAPKTVAQFIRLANEKFYDNIKFHRVEKGFVVQAGDPDTLTTSSAELAGMSQQQMVALGIGAGGSGKNIPFEANKLAHIRGTVAMALSSPRSDTGDSQFFINLSDNVGLNEDYCVFGRVVQGMEIVDKIAVGDAIESMRAD